MIIWLRGVGFVNKGAELMLYAVLKQAEARGHSVAVDIRTGTYSQRRELKLLHLVRFASKKYPVLSLTGNLVGLLLPPIIRRRWDLVTEREVDAVFDAAGFSYGDQWPASYTEDLADNVRRWKSAGKKVVLLPQALGPFGEKTRSAFSRVLEHADLVFARDVESFEYAAAVGGPFKSLRLAPDFTNIVPGVVPRYWTNGAKSVCIIPNYRIVEKGGVNSDDYILFL